MSGTRKRRSIPHLLLGVLLVVTCAGAGVFIATQLGHRQSVLALTRAVSVGQVLATQDVKQVSISADIGLDVVPASASSTVVGSPVAYSMPAGALLTRSLLGAAQVPAPGRAITAVGLKSGQFPPALSMGTAVIVLAVPALSTAATSGGVVAGNVSSWPAVVAGVESRRSEQTTVVSLEMSEQDARRVAVVPAGQMSIVAIGGRP